MKDRFGFDWSNMQGAPYWKKPMLGRRMFFRHAASAVGGYFLMPGMALLHALATPTGLVANSPSAAHPPGGEIVVAPPPVTDILSVLAPLSDATV